VWSAFDVPRASLRDEILRAAVQPQLPLPLIDLADAPGHASVHVDPAQLTEQDAVHVTSHFAPFVQVALPDFPRPIVHVA